MVRVGVVFVGLLLAVPAMAGTPVPGELKACLVESDERARLACFDAAMAKLETAPSDFGGEALPRSDVGPQEPAILVARAAHLSVNAHQHFTVTLDNGQVWRQLDSDTGAARFREGDTVRIKRGFMDSYSLTAEGGYGLYKVKRIK